MMCMVLVVLMVLMLVLLVLLDVSLLVLWYVVVCVVGG
jgi:hypothetical protein